MERLPSGAFRYGGPRDTHDDIVMSLALAWYGATFDVPTWSPELIGPTEPQINSLPAPAIPIPDEVVAWPMPNWMWQ
jgi:hypothetical protein